MAVHPVSCRYGKHSGELLRRWSAGFDFDFLALAFFGFGHVDGQDAVLEFGIRFIALYLGGQPDRTLEGAVTALPVMIFFLFFLFYFLFLPSEELYPYSAALYK
jgi:hypothetical protein